jgi:hypothetical protein
MRFSERHSYGPTVLACLYLCGTTNAWQYQVERTDGTIDALQTVRERPMSCSRFPYKSSELSNAKRIKLYGEFSEYNPTPSYLGWYRDNLGADVDVENHVLTCDTEPMFILCPQATLAQEMPFPLVKKGLEPTAWKEIIPPHFKWDEMKLMTLEQKEAWYRWDKTLMQCRGSIMDGSDGMLLRNDYNPENGPWMLKKGVGKKLAYRAPSVDEEFSTSDYNPRSGQVST